WDGTSDGLCRIFDRLGIAGDIGGIEALWIHNLASLPDVFHMSLAKSTAAAERAELDERVKPGGNPDLDNVLAELLRYGLQRGDILARSYVPVHICRHIRELSTRWERSWPEVDRLRRSYRSLRGKLARAEHLSPEAKQPVLEELARVLRYLEG